MTGVARPFCYALLLAFAGTASANRPATYCQGKLGHEFYGDPMPGTEVFPGIVTGMSWKDAKRVAPKLVEGPTTVDLFGKRILGKLNFEYAGKRVVGGVTFTGHQNDAPVEELTERF